MASALQIPHTFKTSYEEFESYPRNLIQQISYPAALIAYATRLEDASPTLFVHNEQDILVPFREFSGHSWERRNISGDVKLKDKLGDQSTVDPITSTRVGELATKRDPTCRFIFIFAGDSRSPLKIARTMLLRILTYHQVMPNYLDFIAVFGSQSKLRDLRFSGFREQLSLTFPSKAPEIRSLGRSGRQYQLCYNLKGVEKSIDKHWSIRQVAVHLQFDVEEGTTLWIITKGDLELKNRVEDMTGPKGRPEDRAFDTPAHCFRSSLAVHLLQCSWSTEGWRWYIQWLEVVLEEDTHIAVHGARGRNENQRIFTPKDLQSIQHLEDKVNEAIMVQEANSDVLTSLRKFYERLMDNKDFPLRTACCEDVLLFATQLDDMIYDSKMQIARAKVLVKITEDRKTLVLQHLQSQATEKMEILSIKMHEIGSQSQKEAIAMRIITVVTLIYLPATFVSTFFSTDIVKYQDAGNGSFSEVAMVRWLEVTIPLTVLTLSIGYGFFKVSEKKSERLALLPFSMNESKTSFSG